MHSGYQNTIVCTIIIITTEYFISIGIQKTIRYTKLVKLSRNNNFVET